MPANYTPEEIQKAHEILYNEGIKMRYQVAGKEYVDKSLAAASNPFAKAMQDVSSFFLPLLLFVTLLLTWTYTVRLRILLGINLDVSLFSFFLSSSLPNPPLTPFPLPLPLSRPGLPLKIRSFLNIAMLCNQNRSTELATHVKGALNNGASEEEIREVILQAACYCGMPAGIEGFRVAGRAVQEWHEQKLREGEMSRGDQDRHYDVDVASRSKED